MEANKRAQERTQAGHAAKKDFFYYLLNAKDPETGRGLTTAELWGEANVLMIAGSDTTSTTLTATIFYLVRNRRAMDRLTAEIRGAFITVDEITSSGGGGGGGGKLNELVYLRACIDEALRLAPAVPGASPREIVSPGGAVVDGVFLPAGTDCGTPTYSIHRQSRYYREPLSYVPERWIEGATISGMTNTGINTDTNTDSDTDATWCPTREEIEVARKAFCPFSIGPRACIGKSMAMMEMRLTIARMLFLFDIEGFDGLGEDEGGHLALTDHFTSAKDGPNVVIRRRV